MFIRTAFSPARTIASIVFSVFDEGPRVARIFALLIEL
jgi:hypothetical protein